MAKELSKQNTTKGLTEDEILSAFKLMDVAQIKKICDEGVKNVQKKLAREKFNIIEDILLANDDLALIIGSDQNTKPVIKYAFESLFNNAIIKSADGNDISCSEYLITMCAAKVKDEDDRRAKRRERYEANKSNAKSSKSNNISTNSPTNNTSMAWDDVVQMFIAEHPNIDKESASNLLHKAYDDDHKTVDKIMRRAYEIYTTT